MDNLTHGLMGLAIGALRRPEGDAKRGRRLSATDRAVLLAGVLGAELPDLDGLWPAQNEVLGAIFVHRGISHALLFAPIWAALAAGVAWAVFRGARAVPPFASALLSVLFAHLAADAWTGWGTRLLLPFSDARLSWDWMVVVDPLFTAPLLLGAVVAVVRRSRWRMALLSGLALSASYLGTRVVVKERLEARVAASYPQAVEVSVFPDWFGLMQWRYVAEFPESYLTGNVGIGGPLREARSHPKPERLPAPLADIPTVREAVFWARFPVLRVAAAEEGFTARVADLRYHLYGEPTLQMVIDVDARSEVTSARLERTLGGRELWRRWRAGPPGEAPGAPQGPFRPAY